MKFLIDAHLPPLLCRVLERAGHSSETTLVLPRGNRSTDEQIKEFSSTDDCIVVTKDKDFYYSHVLFRSPRKLLLVRCGNLRLRALLSLFERHLSEIEQAFERCDLVELFTDEVREA
jgi:predicted nuclease of predicted toxin-antitoxin system